MTLHATHHAAFDPACLVCSSPSRTYTTTTGMIGVLNPDPLRAPGTDEPWAWECPRCTAAVPRADVADHVADHDAHPEAVIAWIAVALLAWAVVGAIVWLVVRRG